MPQPKDISPEDVGRVRQELAHALADRKTISVSELARIVGLQPPRLFMSMRIERNKAAVIEWRKGMQLADQAMATAFYDSPAAVPHTVVADADPHMIDKGCGRTTTLLLTAMASAYNGVRSVFIVGDDGMAYDLAGRVAEWCDLLDIEPGRLGLDVMSREMFNKAVRENVATFRDHATFYDHEQPKWV